MQIDLSSLTSCYNKYFGLSGATNYKRVLLHGLFPIDLTT